MARINLLPWREQLREERKQRFLVSLVGVLVVAAGLVFLGINFSVRRSATRMREMTSSRRRSQFSMRVSRKSVS